MKKKSFILLLISVAAATGITYAVAHLSKLSDVFDFEIEEL